MTTSATEAELADAVFSTDGDLVNLKSQYAACSYGAMEFIPATSEDYGNTISITDGVNTVIDTNNFAEGGNTLLIQGNVTNQLADQVGAEWPGYSSDRYAMYCMPPGTLFGGFPYLAYSFLNDNYPTGT